MVTPNVERSQDGPVENSQMDYERHIALGDIHGCVHALEAILEVVEPTPRDLIVCLGDVIDYGRDSKAVIEMLMTLKQQSNLVLIQGNHEEMLFAAIEDSQMEESWLSCGGMSTVNSYRFCGDVGDIAPSHIEFLRSSVDYLETDSHIFVHANYCAEKPMEETPPYTLRWSLVEDKPSARHISGKPVIVGHTEQTRGEILNLGSLICIDTYCRGYGWLTAYDCKAGTVWQASRWGVIREAGETVDAMERMTSVIRITES